MMILARKPGFGRVTADPDLWCSKLEMKNEIYRLPLKGRKPRSGKISRKRDGETWRVSFM